MTLMNHCRSNSLLMPFREIILRELKEIKRGRQMFNKLPSSRSRYGVLHEFATNTQTLLTASKGG